MSDDPHTMQAKCIVQALDNYLSTRLGSDSHAPLRVQQQARESLISTLAASLRMSEPRKSDIERAK